MRPASLPTVAAVLLFLLAVGVPAAADEVRVRGRITDTRTGAPVPGVNISAPHAATVSDVDGAFELLAADGDSITISHVAYLGVRRLASSAPLLVALQPAVARLEAVVVRAGLTSEPLHTAPASVTVVGASQLRRAGASHLQDLTASVPNLNLAGGTSRPQYFQVRGIGERSRYAGEGPPSFSVGMVVDDVDLSGLGTAGLLADVDQVEVYRGPQSTIFGANAMAGLISLRSSDPGPQLNHGVTAQFGGDGLASGRGYLSLPLTTDLAARFSYGHSRSDGFRHNEYLGVDDSNRRRETVARVKLRYAPEGGPAVKATLFRVRADNGYDAWAPDNNEDLVTYSDQPGVDDQETTAFSVRGEWPLQDDTRLVSITSYSTTDSEYSFDSDWGNDDFWARPAYGVEGGGYAFFDRMARERTTGTQELRAVADRLPGLAGRGVVGIYAKRLQQETGAAGYLFAGDASVLTSAYEIDELAVYGRYRRDLSDRLRLTALVRADRFRNDYEGDSGLADEVGQIVAADTVRFTNSGWLTGGRLALSYTLTDAETAFASVSRGYRAGGVNQHPRLAAGNRPFDAEYVISYEAGYRFTGSRSTTRLTLFHSRRSSQQVELSTQQDAGDPSSFVYFTNNAGGGWIEGLELEQQLRPSPSWTLSASVGLLASHIDAYSFQTAQGASVRLGDRAAAHAPSYNARIGLRYVSPAGAFVDTEMTRMDEFFYSDSHDQRSESYRLVHAGLGLEREAWSIRLWGRNLLDERYGTRGFFFGLEPPDYGERLYVSYGDPRQVGVTLTAHPGELIDGR